LRGNGAAGSNGGFSMPMIQPKRRAYYELGARDATFFVSNAIFAKKIEKSLLIVSKCEKNS
jgi:hypothetical protein